MQTALAGKFRAATDNIDTVSGGTANMDGNYVLLTKSGVTWSVGTSNVLSGTTTFGTSGNGNVMTYAGQDAQGRHWIICGGASTYTNAYSLVFSGKYTDLNGLDKLRNSHANSRYQLACREINAAIS